MELKFTTLDLAQQNQVPCAQNGNLLNSFENVLTKEIIWNLVLFWKKIQNKLLYRLFF